MNKSEIIKLAKQLRALLETLAEDLPDEEAQKNPHAYPAWKTDTAYTTGERLRYGEKLYKVLQNHTSQADWTPDVAVSLFVEVTPEGVIPEWKQPTGAQDAYAKGDKVKHNGSVWISTVDNNVWEPGVYGWEAA